MMTQYMHLLMENAPYNLIYYMVIPMVIAETIAITEILKFYKEKDSRVVNSLNKLSSVLGGVAMLVLGTLYAVHVLTPAIKQHSFLGWVDSVSSYLFVASALPLILITLLVLGRICRKSSEHKKQGVKIVFLSLYLFLSHSAMALGMLDPAIGLNTPATIFGDHMHDMTVRANEYSNHEPIYMAQPVVPAPGAVPNKTQAHMFKLEGVHSAPGAVPNKPHCGQGTQKPMAQMPEHHHLH